MENCDICGTSIFIEDIEIIDNFSDGIPRCVCSDCSSNLDRCDSCGYLFFNDELHCSDFGTAYLCEGCYNNRHEINNSTIPDLRPIPFRYTYYRMPFEKQSPLLYYGIELEIGTVSLDKKVFCDLITKLPSFIYFQYDASIFYNDDVRYGVELTSHPMTYNYIKAHYKEWNKVLNLRKHNILSFDLDSCGMHIHLSKNYFSSDHLYKILCMIYRYRKFSKFIAQRYSSEFASLQNRIKQRWGTLREKAKTKYYDTKYTAVNLSHSDTIEFRLFKGTLYPLSFWKNLEYLNALVQYTETTDIKKIRLNGFLEYIYKYKKLYPHLYRFIVNRKDKPFYNRICNLEKSYAICNRSGF